MGARLAWVLAGVSGALVVADVLVTAQYRSLVSQAAIAVHGFPFVDGAVLGSAVMGALIVTRDRRQVIGWLLVAIGTAGSFSVATEAYAAWVLDNHGPGSRVGAGISGWLSSLLGGQLAITGMVLLFLLVPDGRFLSPRWRIAAIVAVAGEVLIALGVLTVDPRTFDLTAQRAGGGAAPRELLNSVGFAMITLGLLAALVSMVVRLRRSSGVERQQLRVVALSAASICGGIAWLQVAEPLADGPQSYVTVLPLFIAYLLFPILLSIAVLRYRLYDVEVIVNRTLVLALGTAFAALGYIALVVMVGDVVDSRTSDYWLSLVATALVAVAFQPLRRTVVATANRVAFGVRAQPYEALAAFSRRLSATPSAETVLSTVADAAGRAVSAHGATASLDASGLPRSSAFWGSDCAHTPHEHAVPVQEGGISLGTIEVSIPNGRPLRSPDVRLLRAIADQAAVAFHNMAMEAQLNGHVVTLDRTTKELASSRARIVEADDAARRSLADGISRVVLPHLWAVSDELDQPCDALRRSPPRIDGMVTEVNMALESLRELTHGIFPAQLGRSGLEPALRSYLRERRLGSLLEIAPEALGQRFAPRVEAAVYFAATRAVGTGRERGAIVLGIDGDDLACTVRGTEPAPSDLQTIRDRVEAVGGTLRLSADALELRVPVPPGAA
ncbi:MAG: hypothetical protein ACJ72A_20185 [Nocardioidaceae bacterium]